MNKYGCHIHNIAHTVNTLNGNKDSAFLHIYAKTQLTTTYTSHVIAKHVLDTKIPSKLDICVIYA